jgi:hypothetical protein
VQAIRVLNRSGVEIEGLVRIEASRRLGHARECNWHGGRRL